MVLVQDEAAGYGQASSVITGHPEDLRSSLLDLPDAPDWPAAAPSARRTCWPVLVPQIKSTADVRRRQRAKSSGSAPLVATYLPT